MNENNDRLGITAFAWWTRQVILILAGCFFLFFGVHLLVAAYNLKDPAFFVMTFFASNLIILISAVLIIGFVLKGIATLRAPDDGKGDGVGGGDQS
ncbi:MAG: hypothetical protein JRH13_01485 [Deltaproteobacteria bacterium]|nr:hypothetical protein [Deltaproteobacteria bacterium]MBW2015393.1 hypothetical protein [Deltaproteobacteria bacterium]MBW2128021.1 hypothetical protein [Deltaproteobacteria bacterium]MBW2302600.1 hypothetical protein [Deltaproteobacteria bacterium]